MGRNTVEKVSKGAFFVTLSDRFPPKKMQFSEVQSQFAYMLEINVLLIQGDHWPCATASTCHVEWKIFNAPVKLEYVITPEIGLIN